MSVLVYNNVTLSYPETTSFSQDVVYDESNTDWTCTKYDISVQCIVNANYLNIIAPDIAGKTTNAAEIMNVIRSRLLKPRRAISFKFNGIDIIPAATAQPVVGGLLGAQQGFVDVKNGPQPQRCLITLLTNTTFFLQYHITAHYWENNLINSSSPLVTNRTGSPVLSNRWTETQEIDEKGFTTRTREGKFIIRSDNSAGQIVDVFRSSLAVTGVPASFLRVSSSYTVSPDGLGIQYRITDKEQFKMPPKPAFKASGEYTESTVKSGAIRYGEVRVRLEGSRSTDQGNLIDAALAVAVGKLHLRGAQIGGAFTILENASVRIGLYENDVEVHMRMMRPMSGEGTVADRVQKAINAFGTMTTETPGSTDISYVPSYQDRGSAPILLQAAAYYDPSLSATLNQTNGQMTAGLEVGQAGTQQEP